MKTGVQSLLWSAAAILLLLSTVVPVINILTVTLIIVPYVVLFVTLPLAKFAVHMLAIWVAAFLMLGAAGPIIGMFFAVPAVVMGYLFRKRAPAGRVLTIVTLTFLAMFLLQLMIFTFAFDFSPIKELSQLIRESTDRLRADGILPGSWTSDMTESLIVTMTQSVPVALIAISFLYTVIAQWLSRQALRLHGLQMPQCKRAKDWMLPKVLVIYYLLVLVVDLFVTQNDGSFMSVALLNLLPLLRFAFTIQAIGFFFYIADQKGWHKSIPILISIPVLLFPPLSLIGVLDVAFPIRKSFTKP